MKKKTLAVVLALGCALSLAACGSSSDSSSSQASQAEADATASADAAAADAAEADDTAADAEVEDTEGYSDMGDMGDITALNLQTYESDLGFSIDYDPAFVEVEESDDSVSFTYTGDEDLDLNVYIAIDYHSDMSAEILTNGLVLQSGQDDVEAQLAYFGADGIETQEVYITEDVNGINQIVVSHVIDMGDDTSLLVEMGGYEGMPAQAEYTLEMMLDTFKLTD